MDDLWDILKSAVGRHPDLKCRMSRCDHEWEALEESIACDAKASDVFRVASILHPKFVNINGTIVRETEYIRHHEPQDISRRQAALINHEHVTDLIQHDELLAGYVDEVGRIIAFFWKRAVEHQFPREGVNVEYNSEDGAVYVWQSNEGEEAAGG